jgi:hypothetical protein
MDENEIVQTIMEHIIDSYQYERLLNLYTENINQDFTYEQFLIWNNTCILKMNNGERLWTRNLCLKIGFNLINLVDLEPCVPLKAVAIYFDTNGQLCIVNPR